MSERNSNTTKIETQNCRIALVLSLCLKEILIQQRLKLAGDLRLVEIFYV